MLIQADARRIPLADGTVQCCVTSPAYWSLRDYSLPPSIFGGDPGCEHVWGDEPTRTIVKPQANLANCGANSPAAMVATLERLAEAQSITKGGQWCTLCGAWRGCLGLEPTPELYVQHIVEIFREVKRVLRDDGTCWVNLGDSYAGSGPMGTGGGHGPGSVLAHGKNGKFGENQKRVGSVAGLKPKDLVGIPWRVAFALQADGWWLRDSIVWAKGWVNEEDVNEGSVMPGSQRDRCTSAYEMVFMLTKAARYYFDIDGQRTTSGATMRNVWRINTASFKGAHFATFAPKLAERCILLSTSAKGACPICGSPWERTTEKGEARQVRWKPGPDKHTEAVGGQGKTSAMLTGIIHDRVTTGWRPTCDCYPKSYKLNRHPEAKVVPCIVLDPFCGSGTTGMVAIKHGREFVGLDLNGEYLHDLAAERLSKIQPVLL